jgi:antitoxin component YwqK of YwqJK toxin-antitoxin module
MGICIAKQTYENENFTNSNVKQFEGTYINKQKNGYCIEFSKEGDIIYEGQWINNTKEGLGKLYHNKILI